INTGDIVVATAAAPVDGATRTHLGGEPYAPVPDFDLTRALVDAARASGLPTHVGPVATVDLLYNPDPDYVPRWRNRGILAFEMEAAALFYLASRASAEGRDARAACILTVSDVLSETLTTEETYLPLDELERATDRMIVSALDGSLAFDAT
ncbi:MAG: purine-nucleoside phosphorylase, partial [Chloroflexi bacterium]|nr:purine-nucleoside phosphorylase [Chloroflexota bacterium]